MSVNQNWLGGSVEWGLSFIVKHAHFLHLYNHKNHLFCNFWTSDCMPTFLWSLLVFYFLFRWIWCWSWCWKTSLCTFAQTTTFPITLTFTLMGRSFGRCKNVDSYPHPICFIIIVYSSTISYSEQTCDCFIIYVIVEANLFSPGNIILRKCKIKKAKLPGLYLLDLRTVQQRS
jgi:hypothetical protein